MKNSLNKPLSVCFYGSYDRNYSRNQILLKGLKQVNVRINEVNLELPKMSIDKPEHLNYLTLLSRLLRKIKLVPLTIKHWQKIKDSDVIFSPIPTHLDLPFAYIVSRILGKHLIFDSLYGLSVSFIDEFGLKPRNSLQAFLLRFMDKIVFKLADAIVFDTTVSRETYSRLFQIPFSKTRILPLGADEEIYSHAGINGNKKMLNVVYYGLFNPMHGVEYIIAAADILRNEKEIKFIMLGKGQTYEINKKRAIELNLTNIIFYPDVTETNAKEYLEESDVFLGFLNKSQSSEISFPNKVFQGLALGKVVITAETKLTKSEFLQKENIYLVKPSDAISLASAIKNLLLNRNLRQKIASGGYQLFRSKYTSNSVGKKFKLILEDIIK